MQIAIYVIDENDEEPELCDDKFNSTFRIPEKSPSGTTIVKICARDNDRTCECRARLFTKLSHSNVKK